MSLIVACAACGEGIAVADEMIQMSQSAGVPLSVTHEVCPRDAKVLPQYIANVTISRKFPDGEVELVRVGGTVEAPTLNAALPALWASVTNLWARSAPLAEVAEAGISTPSKGEDDQ